MASWRDSASQGAQDDLDGLLNAALPFAQEMLTKRGEFFPYAVSLASDGETSIIAGDPGTGERPASLDVLATLVSGLRERSPLLRAAAVVADVRVDGSDAIRVELEHREGHAMTMFLLYTKKRFGRGVEFGEFRGATAGRQIWHD